MITESKLTRSGFVKKVRTAIERHGGRCAVINDSSGLHFVSAESFSTLIAIYDGDVLDDWLLDDAESLGLRG